MDRTKHLAAIGIFIIILTGCRDDMENTKYARPDWLAGKVYTQLKAEDDLSVFASCVERVGYDTIINVSGSYTVFAPTDDAFTEFFQIHPQYNTVDDIPIEELSRLVKFHIVQNPWSKRQLTTLDVYGWIDTLDINNDEPRGFKRETLLLDKDTRYGIVYDEAEKRFNIVDTTEADLMRRVITDSRKFVPFFYKEYFEIYDLDFSDYEFYFDRSFGGAGDIYFAGAKIIADEIFAENGFVYKVDRVIEPMRNTFQFLSEGDGQNSYQVLLDLLNLYPEFTYDEEKTNDQPGAKLGLDVDSLFRLRFPDLTFNFTNEETIPPRGSIGLPSNVTIRYHHGLIAPTDEAFANFIDEYFVGGNRWGSLKNAPDNIKQIVANSHMLINPVYPSEFQVGFYNGEQDRVVLDEADIVNREFGSNASIIAVSEAIVPRAFKSITGPVYLQKGYSFAMYAIEQSGLLPALKRENQDYLFFVESDANCRLDSSFLYNPGSQTFSAFLIPEFGARIRITIPLNDIRTLLLNHVGVARPKGIARKEFVKNLAGNFLIFNNETGQVTGTAPTTFGFGGAPSIDYPTQISTDTDNGTTYSIDNWFSFSTTTLFTKINQQYPYFQSLLSRAGLLRDPYSYNFTSENENYTVFIPHDSAFENMQVDTLTQAELKDLLLFHFVQGDLIFTDGNKTTAYYETLRPDESSTTFNTVFTRMYIDPGIDVINIPDTGGGNFVSIAESDQTNILVGRTLGDGQSVYPNIVNNGVIHEIPVVLNRNDIDTQ